MVVKRHVELGVTVISVSDRLVLGSGNRQEFESAILEGINGTPWVVLDASGVEFFESDGMDCLISLESMLSARSGRLVLTGINDSVAQVFRLSGLDCLFKIYPNVDTAVVELLRRRSSRERVH